MPTLGPPAPRGRRGLTLIEILTVIALLGLVMAVIVAMIFPSDERKLKLEAERLAAYLEKAGAEAPMSESAIRVWLRFENGAYGREIARLGAQLGALTWAEDTRAQPDALKVPVKFLGVQVPDVGELEAGTGWLVWEDTRTRGGVVVLGLNESIWSVIVDPATGHVRTEKGKAAMPAGRAPLRRSLPRDVVALLGDEGRMPSAELQNLFQNANMAEEPPPMAPPTDPGALPDSPPGTGSSPSGLPPTVEPGTGNPTEAPAEPTEPPTEPPPTPDAGLDLDAAAQHDAAPSPPDQGPPSGEEPTCEPECQPRNGVPFVCASVQGEDGETPQCVPDPRGFTFRATRFRLTGLLESVDEGGMIQAVVSSLLNDRGYKFFMTFPPRTQDESASFRPLGFYMYLVQGGVQLGDGSYRADGSRTLSRWARSFLVPTQTQDDAIMGQYVVFPYEDGIDTLERARRRGHTVMKLAVPYVYRQSPCFWTFSTVLQIQSFLIATSSGGVKLVSKLFTCVGERSLDIPMPGGRTLAEQLREEVGADPTCDSNRDGLADGWDFELAATMQKVDFRDDPSEFLNTNPGPACQ